MATLSFNKDNRIDDFTFILVRKDNYNIGTIHARDVNFNHNFNGPDELSLKVYKDLDPNFNRYWERLNDYNDLYVPQLGTDGYFEIEVTVNEDSEGVYKTITATSRCESELSHVKIYNYEINSDEEIANDPDWDKEHVTRFYRRIPAGATDEEIRQIKHRSILHRLLDKLPNYTIEHVDETLVDCTDWYQFSWDDTDVYSIMTGDLADQYHVLFNFDSKNRTISAYDLYSVCMNDDCNYRQMMIEDRNIYTRYRGDFHHVCPQCGSSDITEGRGKFTKIIVSKDNLTTSAQVSSNKDNLINCFKVLSGDELMDAALINQNPNGSAYIYQFSKDNMEEMPPELVQKLNDYNLEYDLWYNGDEDSGKGIYTFTADEVNQLNELISYCQETFSEERTEDFIPLKTKYVGYQSLASQFYSIMDVEGFYRTSMTPDLDSSHLSIDDTMSKLLEDNMTHINPLATFDPSTVSLQSVESALIQSAKCVINTAYFDIAVINSGQESSYTSAQTKTGTGTWQGKLRLRQIEYIGTPDEQTYTRDTNVLTITVNGEMNAYISQRIDAMVNRKDTSLIDLNAILYQELEEIKKASGIDTQKLARLKVEFRDKLREYGLDVLTDVVRPCYEDVYDILEQNSEKIKELYWDLYRDHLLAIDDEISDKSDILNNIIVPIRQKIAGVFDADGNVITDGYRQITQNALNFENFLGEDLYKVFCDYRREDTYKNDNYVYDDLNNSSIFRRAGELMDAAQKELYKASHLQFDVSGSLNNLLALPEFASIKDDFEVGNWIKMSVDDVLYDLRLLSYSINFSELQTIGIKFSTVEEIWSGASDIQSVLQAAGSIAGSYPAIQSQVKNNEESAKIVDDWVNDGLSATMTKFANDPVTQEILYDSHGLYARGYDDTTGEYLPQQLKIVKNGMYLTSDNWDHIRTGVGAISYIDPEYGTSVDTYGIIADTVVGKLILGENLKIFNSNAGLKMDENGLTITGKEGSGVVKINPNDSSQIFQILNGSTKKLWADNNGDVSMTGTITANSGYIGGTSGWSIITNAIYNGTNSMSSTVPGTYIGTAGIRQYASSSAYVNIQNGVVTAQGANITGTITATNLTATNSGTIGPWTISPTSLYKGTNAMDGPTAGNAYIGNNGISFTGRDMHLYEPSGTGQTEFLVRNNSFGVSVRIASGTFGDAGLWYTDYVNSVNSGWMLHGTGLGVVFPSTLMIGTDLTVGGSILLSNANKSIYGNLVGNVTGNVTGNISGNASTCTTAPFKIQTMTVDNIQVAAARGGQANFQPSVPNGYSILGVVYINYSNASTGGTNSTAVVTADQSISGSTVTVTFRNVGNNAAIIKVTVRILMGRIATFS